VGGGKDFGLGLGFGNANESGSGSERGGNGHVRGMPSINEKGSIDSGFVHGISSNDSNAESSSSGSGLARRGRSNTSGSRDFRYVQDDSIGVGIGAAVGMGTENRDMASESAQQRDSGHYSQSDVGSISSDPRSGHKNVLSQRSSIPLPFEGATIGGEHDDEAGEWEECKGCCGTGRVRKTKGDEKRKMKVEKGEEDIEEFEFPAGSGRKGSVMVGRNGRAGGEENMKGMVVLGLREKGKSVVGLV